MQYETAPSQTSGRDCSTAASRSSRESENPATGSRLRGETTQSCAARHAVQTTGGSSLSMPPCTSAQRQRGSEHREVSAPMLRPLADHDRADHAQREILCLVRQERAAELPGLRRRRLPQRRAAADSARNSQAIRRSPRRCADQQRQQIELPLGREAPGRAEEAHPDIGQHAVREQPVRHRQMGGDADAPVARPAAGPDVARRTVRPDPGHVLEAGRQRLHRHGEGEHHQEHRIDPRHARDQERPRAIGEAGERLHDHQAAEDEEHVHPGAAVLEQPVQPGRHRHERQRVAEHDVERQHAPQPIQAHQSPHAAQHRGGGLTSREKFLRRLHPIGPLATIGDSGH